MTGTTTADTQHEKGHLLGSRWYPDLLGGHWVAQQLVLPNIREFKTVATLVTTRPELERHRTTAVLYLHGYNDYFFHTHVAQFFDHLGYAFYALDLHGYGRSTTDEESRNNCWSLLEYGPDLGAATRYLKEVRNYREIIILGHSTGGLIASLWALSQLGRATVSGLILNSPWLDLSRPWFDRVVATTALDVVGEYLPEYSYPSSGSRYAGLLHTSNGGPWGFDLDLKRSRSTPVRMGWLRAIREGQLRVSQGLGLHIPILVLTSDRSGPPLLTDQDVARDKAGPNLSGITDIVLDVEQIAARAPLLGQDVTVAQIPHGIHDLSLGNLTSQDRYFGSISAWLKDNAATFHPVPRQTPTTMTI